MRALTSPSSFASSIRPFLSTSRITGTTSPFGVSTATPIWKYCLRTRLSPSADSEALNSGCCFSATTTAFSRKQSMVKRMPCFFASSVWTLRNSSSSVMSAWSFCVTCGMVTQLRCRFAPESFLMRESGWVVTAPNFAKSTCGSGSRLSPAPPSRAARARELALHVVLDVLLEHALLGSRALHARQVHAQLAREAPHRGARMRRAKPASSTCRREPGARRRAAAARA